jgi:hypothetical protein
MGNTLYVDSDNAIYVEVVKNVLTGEWINDAVVTATLLDADGEPVEGAEEIVCAYIAGSNGRYLGGIPADVELVSGDAYTLQVVVQNGDYKTTSRKTYVGGYYKG